MAKEYILFLRDLEDFLMKLSELPSQNRSEERFKKILEFYEIDISELKLFPDTDSNKFDEEAIAHYSRGISFTNYKFGKEIGHVTAALNLLARNIQPEANYPFKLNITEEKKTEIKIMTRSLKELYNLPMPKIPEYSFFKIRDAIMLVFFRLTTFESGSLVPIFDLVKDGDIPYLLDRNINWKEALEGILNCLSKRTELPAPYYPLLGVLERTDDLTKTLKDLELSFDTREKLE